MDENGNLTGELATTTDYTKADKYYIGTALPDFQGGITTEFAWKGLDLSIATNYQLGGKIYDSMYTGFMHAGNNAGSNWHKDILNAWTPENKNSDIPRFQFGDKYNAVTSSRFLTSTNYLNISNINFGYTFPAKWFKGNISALRLYVACDNVWYWSARKGFDPRGTGTAQYSPIRTISGGVNLTF